MAVLTVARHGDPLLTESVEQIHEVTDAIREFVNDMVDTMRHRETPGVGLAASQVVKRLSIVVPSATASPRARVASSSFSTR